jgi:hypothetical protein
MTSIKIIALVITGLWVVGVFVVGFFWMGQEYALIEKDNGDGTVTFRDGPEKATSTKGEFFAEAVKNSLLIVLFFPTAPYLGLMLVVGIVWLVVWRVTRRKSQPVEDDWGAPTDGTTMGDRWAKLNDRPREQP